MTGSDRVLYPMLGTGSFFVMFWVGFVCAYELGFVCDSMLINGLLFGGVSAWLVARLEVREQQHSPAPARRPEPARATSLEARDTRTHLARRPHHA